MGTTIWPQAAEAAGGKPKGKEDLPEGRSSFFIVRIIERNSKQKEREVQAEKSIR